MSGKKHKREIKRQRDAVRAAARKRQRQQTTLTVIVVAILVGIGGLLIAFSLEDPQPAAQPTDEPTATPTDEATPDPDAVACEGQKPAQAGEDKPTFSRPRQVLRDGVDYRARIVTSCGLIEVDLDERRAPETVNNFVFLARLGFFDGLKIFRNATSIGALQTGSGTNEAAWDIGYTLPDELDAAEADGYPPGTLAMANAGPDSGGSQFFFVYNDKFTLDPAYSVFGKVTRGMATLRLIGDVPNTAPESETPSRPAYLERVTILAD